MKKKLFVFLVASYCSFPTLIQAQSSENNPKTSGIDIEPERRKWEVGLDVLSLLRNINSSSTNVSLNIRKYSKNKINKSALDLLISPTYTHIKSIDLTNLPTTNLTASLALGISKEFQIQSGKFMFLYGPGVGIAYQVASVEQEYSKISTNSFRKDWNIDVNGFIGARFFINSRLSVSAKSKLILTNEYQNQTNKSFVNNILTSESTSSFTAYRLDVIGISSLQVGYHF